MQEMVALFVPSMIVDTVQDPAAIASALRALQYHTTWELYIQELEPRTDRVYNNDMADVPSIGSVEIDAIAQRFHYRVIASAEEIKTLEEKLAAYNNYHHLPLLRAASTAATTTTTSTVPNPSAATVSQVASQPPSESDNSSDESRQQPPPDPTLRKVGNVRVKGRSAVTAPKPAPVTTPLAKPRIAPAKAPKPMYRPQPQVTTTPSPALPNPSQSKRRHTTPPVRNAALIRAKRMASTPLNEDVLRNLLLIPRSAFQRVVRDIMLDPLTYSKRFANFVVYW